MGNPSKMTVVVAGISNRRIEEITGLSRLHSQTYLAANAETLRNAMETCGLQVATTLWKMREGKKWPERKKKEVVEDEQIEKA